MSAGGHLVVTADGGPNRYGLTLFDDRAAQPLTSFVVRSRRAGDADEEDWHSVFMGLAFDGEAALFASEGESGRIRRVDLRTGKGAPFVDLEPGGAADSYTGDLAFDPDRGLLYVVDQANFRLAIVDLRRHALISSIRTGRLPFAIALSPDRKTAYVTNLGMFEYRALPGADPKRPETGLPFPAFGFPSADAAGGASRPTSLGPVDVPGLGDPNAPGSNSLAILDVSKPAAPRLVALLPTGLPFGGSVLGGSSPSGVAASSRYAFTSPTPIRIPSRSSMRAAMLACPRYSVAHSRIRIAPRHSAHRHDSHRRWQMAARG